MYWYWRLLNFLKAKNEMEVYFYVYKKNYMNYKTHATINNLHVNISMFHVDIINHKQAVLKPTNPPPLPSILQSSSIGV